MKQETQQLVIPYISKIMIFFIGLASDLWSILTFSRKSSEELTVPDQNDFQHTPLATQSLLLILVLVHHWTTQSNPYRSSLFSCLNSLGTFRILWSLQTFSATLFQTIIQYHLQMLLLYSKLILMPCT